MSEGIRATVEFPARAPCPIAGVSAETESVVDGVWTSVSATGSSPTVSEFIVESPEPPERPDLRHVLSLGGRHLLRLDHGGEEPRLGGHVQQLLVRDGVVPHPDGPVGALRQGHPNRLLGALGPDGDGDDLDILAGFLDLDGLLDGVVVPLVELVLHVLLADAPILDLERVLDGRDLLDRYEHLHAP